MITQEQPQAQEQYLVEVECGGKEAIGGGCGSWYVARIRGRKEGDIIGRRASPNRERAYYTDRPDIYENWEKASESYSIHVQKPCSECYRSR